MCGITGFLCPNPSYGAKSLEEVVRTMAVTLAHRGPDDSGVWTDQEVGLALGHRRLSILDLSEKGHQPMRSSSGRYVLVFNGEIYNFRDIRTELLGENPDSPPRFTSQSDTEVMLAAFECWGIRSSVLRFNGMFAFVVWDRCERTLHLGRDRTGQKPLYYGWSGNTFLFGSELKALRAHPSFRGEIDPHVLGDYLRYLAIPAPKSIYRGVFKLPPGCLLSLPMPATSKGPGGIEPIPYWSAREVAEKGRQHPFSGSIEKADSELESLLMKAVKRRMVSDVPLGSLLSGGIDSSLVTALMQAQSQKPIKTFTIGFRESGWNEAEDALKISRHLKTDHTELYLSSKMAMDVIPELSRIYDEPFADSSQIPTYLVSRMSREKVTVALSGDGGDEMFGGYSRYFLAPAIWKKMGWLPLPLRKSLGRLLLAPSSNFWETAEPLLSLALRPYARSGDFASRIPKIASCLTLSNPDELYKRLCSGWENPEKALAPRAGGPHNGEPGPIKTSLRNPVERMMLFDQLTYLPNDILVKVDRASMAASLEVRSPFLDHEVIEFAWGLPLKMKTDTLEGKSNLRRILYKHVPKRLMDRPKTGFGVPIGVWLRGPLREWAESLLSESYLRDSGYFNHNHIRKYWAEHLSGKRDHYIKLWSILMFQQWLRDN